MSKNLRQKKIIEIVTNREVDTQEELVAILNEFNFNVTQATVSRDIKDLGLIKVSGKKKRHMYATNQRILRQTKQNFLIFLKTAYYLLTLQKI